MVTLLFAPSWNLNVGSPHIGIAVIRSALEKSGVETCCRDLNWNYIVECEPNIATKFHTIFANCNSFEEMNSSYFDIEDELMKIAASYKGEWNLQLGFRYDKLSFSSSKDIKNAIELDSPFTAYFREDVIRWINKRNPDIIGISIAGSYQIIPTLQLIWLLRKSGYGGFVLVGGNIISRLKEEIKQCDWLFDLVDGFIYFQGERPLIQITNTLKANKDLSSVSNLIWRQDGSIVENPRENVMNPDDISTPDFEGLPIGKYPGVNYIPLLAARGCYYANCSFCAIPYGYGNNGPCGIRSSQLLIDDMIKLKQKWNINRFKFMDEAMAPKTLKQLSGLILNQSMSFEWEGYLRLEKCWTDARFVRDLGLSGFKKGYFGLEIVPEESRKYLTKSDKAGDLLAIIKRAYDEGIKVHLFCLFGFPGTGKKEAEATIEFILKHKDIIDTVDINPFSYAKHTSVKGVRKIINPEHDWALEYEFEAVSKGALSSLEVESLAAEMEEVLWQDCPRLLHPNYRLFSPWSSSTPINRKNNAVSVAPQRPHRR